MLCISILFGDGVEIFLVVDIDIDFVLGFDWKCLNCFKKDLLKVYVFFLLKCIVGCVSYMVLFIFVSFFDDEGGIRVRYLLILEVKFISIRGSLAFLMILCLEKRLKL